MELEARRILRGMARPVFLTAPPGDAGRLFLAEQHTGRIRIFRPATGRLDDRPFLEIGGLSTGNEQGLLGLAFAPDYATSGHFFVNLTRTDGDTEVRRYRVSDADPNVAEPRSATLVLTVDQPFANHNGGWLAFGPKDGLLYLAFGDGGSAGDPGNRAQDLGQLLGKLLRVDVRGDDFPGDPSRAYAIPPDNPFINTSGARPEIWALGLRNPWRCSFDRKSGDLYIGDVGQDEIEEIDFLPAGRGGLNFGWSLKEGTRPFKPGLIAGQALVDPIDEYTHDEGVTVIGGYVYRGQALPDLAGTYFYADANGTFTSFRFDGTTLTDKRKRTDELFPTGSPSAISSFGEDPDGELYLLNLIPGEVYKITARP